MPGQEKEWFVVLGFFLKAFGISLAVFPIDFLWVSLLIRGLTLYPIFVYIYFPIPCQLLKIGIKLFEKKKEINFLFD